MKANDFSNILGVAIPISALRTEKSCGVGEFLDLIPFAKFCKEAGISLIQILPIYDSGTDNSPYNTLSAFALHPNYISLERLQGIEPFMQEVQELQKALEPSPNFQYKAVLEGKLKILRALFENQKQGFLAETSNPKSKIFAWVSQNHWIKPYAVFKVIKEQHFQSGWKNWSSMRFPTKAEIEQVWNEVSLRDSLYFYVWLQFNLHLQLLEACQTCKDLGIILKGDIPILLNEDSCDVWSNQELFRSDITAGSPPDGENPKGQSWGFPIYLWENHKETNYEWWKSRLKVASQYYQAYRIDHVLGFFRIWASPAGEKTTRLGFCIPQVQIKMLELRQLGFSQERIRWMSEPHIKTETIMQANGGDYLHSHGQLHKVADRIGDEELWLFKPEILSETDLETRGLEPAILEALKKAWADRMLIKSNTKTAQEGSFVIAWDFKETTAWRSFSEEEKTVFLDLAERINDKNERLWKKQGQEVLSQICSSVEAQAFAEDLGNIPSCVPAVLKKLEIFSLKVLRWERNWQEKTQPFIDLKKYQALSVTTTSTHDTSTLLDWWNRELTLPEREQFLQAIKVNDRQNLEQGLSPENALIFLRTICNSPSSVVILPIQDLLVISEKFSADFNQRINTPGTVNEGNWTFRMPITVERLTQEVSLINDIASLRRGEVSSASKGPRSSKSAKGVV